MQYTITSKYSKSKGFTVLFTWYTIPKKTLVLLYPELKNLNPPHNFFVSWYCATVSR